MTTVQLHETHVHALIAASREATHAACQLGSVAALVTRGDGAVHARATDACMEAAKAAFALDDIYRRNNGSVQSLEAADAALAKAEAAIQAARASIAYMRTVAVA